MFNKDRDIGIYTEIDIVQKTIQEANKVNIVNIFTFYNLRIDDLNKKACCPFPFHKNGNEKSASFYYYPSTNSFFCFGCKSSGGAVEFMVNCENITKYAAAIKILDTFIASDTVQQASQQDYNLFYKLNLEFSHYIRDFIKLNDNSLESIKCAEYISKAFDTMKQRYELNNDELNLLVNKLKDKLSKFDGITCLKS